MKNRILWEKVKNITFDKPDEEYSFTTRLAYENNWTEYFTSQAIEEYKKFMYLAAISNQMVSPSEIVDIVWHQHLIYTTSYKDFCIVLDKNIEHIPSTHNKNDKAKFSKAKNFTKQSYEEEFGTQPKELWECNEILDSIKLKPSKENFYTINAIISLIFMVLFVPSCSGLYPILQKIENPDFLTIYILSFALLLFILSSFVKHKNEQLFKKIIPNLVLENLSPYEILLFKKESSYIIHLIVSELIENMQIKIDDDYKLNLLNSALTDDKYKNCIINTLKDNNQLYYSQFMQIVIAKPIFQQFNHSLTKLRFYIENSKKSINIIAIITISLGFFLLVGLSRLFTGFLNDQPALFLIFTLIIQVVISIGFISECRHYFFEKILLKYYKNIKQNTAQIIDNAWENILSDKIILATTLIPLVIRVENNGINSGGCGSSCGASDGGSSGGGSDSSCGGGCGGCGGCGGGGD